MLSVNYVTVMFIHLPFSYFFLTFLLNRLNAICHVTCGVIFKISNQVNKVSYRFSNNDNVCDEVPKKRSKISHQVNSGFYRYSSDSDAWREVPNKTNFVDNSVSYELKQLDANTIFVKVENLVAYNTYDISIETDQQNYEASSVAIHGKFIFVENVYILDILTISISSSNFQILKLENVGK